VKERTRRYRENQSRRRSIIHIVQDDLYHTKPVANSRDVDDSFGPFMSGNDAPHTLADSSGEHSDAEEEENSFGPFVSGVLQLPPRQENKDEFVEQLARNALGIAVS